MHATAMHPAPKPHTTEIPAIAARRCFHTSLQPHDQEAARQLPWSRGLPSPPPYLSSMRDHSER
jgi:hypothetical protein